MIASLSVEYPDRGRSFFPWLMSTPPGWIVRLAKIAARVRHDVVSRTLSDDFKFRISQTNEMQVLHAYKQRDDGKWIVDVRSKITMQLVRFGAFLNWLKEMLGAVMWGIFSGKGYGWMDFPEPNDTESFNMLTCGGNIVEVDEFFGVHALIATQDITAEPDLSKTYENAPQRFVKQGLVGHNKNKESYWIVDQNRGDVIVQLMTNVRATLPISALEFLPKELPFETVLWGRVPVTVHELVFSGSDTWGRIDGGRWVCIEKMEVTGLGSWKDRRLNIAPEDWFYTWPVPVIGWTKGK